MYKSTLIILVSLMLFNSNSFAQNIPFPTKDCEGAYVTPDGLYSWCHDEIDEYYNECDCEFSKKVAEYRRKKKEIEDNQSVAMSSNLDGDSKIYQSNYIISDYELRTQTENLNRDMQQNIATRTVNSVRRITNKNKDWEGLNVGNSSSNVKASTLNKTVNLIKDAFSGFSDEDGYEDEEFEDLDLSEFDEASTSQEEIEANESDEHSDVKIEPGDTETGILYDHKGVSVGYTFELTNETLECSEVVEGERVRYQIWKIDLFIKNNSKHPIIDKGFARICAGTEFAPLHYVDYCQPTSVYGTYRELIMAGLSTFGRPLMPGREIRITDHVYLEESEKPKIQSWDYSGFLFTDKDGFVIDAN